MYPVLLFQGVPTAIAGSGIDLLNHGIVFISAAATQRVVTVATAAFVVVFTVVICPANVFTAAGRPGYHRIFHPLPILAALWLVSADVAAVFAALWGGAGV
jgi:hypothetical protein